MKENDRPPLPDGRSWREDEDSSTKKPLSRGINAKSFHKSSRRNLPKALREASTTVVKQQRRAVTTQLRLQRAAFKEVTSLKTWPLQDLAMKDLDDLLNEKSRDELDNADAEAETHGDSTGLSSSSLDEPKRMRRKNDEDDSPGKNTLKHQYKQEFLSGDKQEALWCMEPRMFSLEKSGKGKRQYIVGHLGRFCDRYWRKVDPKHRHYYELIREQTPCRLYFDLEFSKEANPDITDHDAEELLQELFAELQEDFREHYDLKVDRSCLVDLDSSTCSKFSRHWILHLPNQALFADAGAAGRFVRVLVGRLAEQAATGVLEETRPLLSRYLFVKTKKEETTCMIDLGVYTRNRLFRLLGSSKFGKPASAALRIAESNKFPFPDGFCNHKFYVPEMEKHVQGKQRETNDFDDSVDIDEEVKNFLSSMDWTDHATALCQTLVVPMNVAKLDCPSLSESKEALALLEVKKESATAKTRQSRPMQQAGSSPFPSADDFILNVMATRGGVEGSIRAWSVDDSSGIAQSITYQMSRNRWCERIGRAHKSNNIMFTIYFDTMTCVQTCHDPECRSLQFRGTPVDLPENVKDDIADVLFEQELATMDEKALMEKKTSIVDKEKTTVVEDDFDEEEFERALMALNINDPKERSTQEPKQDNKDDRTQEPLSAAATDNHHDDENSLDDQALLVAIASNPELFP